MNARTVWPTVSTTATMLKDRSNVGVIRVISYHRRTAEVAQV